MSTLQLVEPTMEKGSIADTAERVRLLLVCCQEIKDEESQFLAAHQLARFKQWAYNIGVFAARHASLDYRLRTTKEMKLTLEANLDMVCKHLLATLKASPKVSKEEFDIVVDGPRSHVSAIAKKMLLKSTSSESTRIKELGVVAARLTNLHQIFLDIRRAINQNSLIEIPKLFGFDTEYDIIRERKVDGVELGNHVNDVRFTMRTEFESFVRNTLTYRWVRFRSGDEKVLNDEQKGYRQTLLERCVTIISTRRRQLEYFRTQESCGWNGMNGVASQPLQPLDNIPAQKPELRLTELPESLRGVSKDPTLIQACVLSENSSNHNHEETFVSESVAKNFKPPLSRSAPSSCASTTADDGFGDGSPFEVPPPPKLVGSEKEKACPYCYLVLPAKTFSTQKGAKRWEKHLLEDIQPYICLFAHCPTPGKTYPSFEAWKRHLSKPHYHRWHCSLHSKIRNDIPDRGPLRFNTFEKFKSHIELYHADDKSLSADDSFEHGNQLAALPQWCFICSESLPQPINLLEHMASHFKSMSLLALPWRDDIEDERTIASDKAASLCAIYNNNEEDTVATKLDGINFGGQNKKHEQVIDTATKLKTQAFASLLLAINETPISHQARMSDVKKWTRDHQWKQAVLPETRSQYHGSHEYTYLRPNSRRAHTGQMCSMNKTNKNYNSTGTNLQGTYQYWQPR